MISPRADLVIRIAEANPSAHAGQSARIIFDAESQAGTSPASPGSPQAVASVFASARTVRRPEYVANSPLCTSGNLLSNLRASRRAAAFPESATLLCHCVLPVESWAAMGGTARGRIAPAAVGACLFYSAETSACRRSMLESMQRSRQHAADDTTGLPRSEPPRPREPRGPLPLRDAADFPDAGGMTHEQLVSALRAVDGLVTVAHDPPNLHYRSRPFLHFHQAEGRTYADVRFGSGDFEPVWASTPSERAALLARVCDHIEELERARKSTRRRSDERRRRRGDRD